MEHITSTMWNRRKMSHALGMRSCSAIFILKHLD
jgi:hypothetical protein